MTSEHIKTIAKLLIDVESKTILVQGNRYDKQCVRSGRLSQNWQENLIALKDIQSRIELAVQLAEQIVNDTIFFKCPRCGTKCHRLREEATGYGLDITYRCIDHGEFKETHDGSVITL